MVRTACGAITTRVDRRGGRRYGLYPTIWEQRPQPIKEVPGIGKRGNGEGSIFRRRDGLWAGEVSQDGGKRKTVYGRTRAEVAAKVRQLLRKKELGLALENERETLAAYLADWLENVAKQSLRPSTLRNYKQLVEDYLVPGLGRLQLTKVTPPQVLAFLNSLLNEGRLSPTTVKYVHAVLRAALNQAVRWRLIQYNAAALVPSPRPARHLAPVISPDHAASIVAAVRDHRLEALFSVALAVGLRQGEALGLKWDDVDLEAGQLRVRHSLQRLPKRGLQLVDTKTLRSRRMVALPPTVVLALKRHRARQAEERLAAGDRWTDRGFVFTSEIGSPLDGNNVTKRFQRLLAQAGLPRMRFHDLRHACASLLLAQGVHPRVVMETLGHSQISLTMNTYSHVIPALQREAADRMEAILSRP